MSGIVGRPKNDGLNHMLRVAVSGDDVAALDKTAGQMNITKSDIIRKMVKTISSKDFEEALSQTSLKILENYSIDCWNTLHQENCVFETDGFSERMPAFIIGDNQPFVFVKYPTYKIQVFSDNGQTVKYEVVKNIVDRITNKVQVYITSINMFVVGTGHGDYNNRSVVEMMCLDDGLDNNHKLKNMICTVLKENGYFYSVHNAYCIKGDRITLLEDKKYFKLTSNM